MYYQSSTSSASQKTKLVWRLSVDAAILLSLLVVIGYYGLFGVPFKRGFFCNDSDISHPYRDSSISAAALYTSSIFVPMLVVLLAECVRMRRFRSGWRTCLADGYVHFVIWYGFGALVTQAVIYVIKFYASRLRPHFFAICQPDFAALEPFCSAGQYITDYNCTNTDVTPKRMREAFISFPSGHASFGFHAAAFLALYLRERWDKNFGGVIVRPFVQLAFLVAAFLVCISRVNDFKHHVTDVFAGGMLGILVAVFVYNVLDFAELRATYFWSDDEVPGSDRQRGVPCERGSSVTERHRGEKSRRRREQKALNISGGNGADNKGYKSFDDFHDSLRGAEC